MMRISPEAATEVEEPASTGAQRRRERERAQARATILTAARDLARTDGWDAVTMRRLADRIDYSANFAYRYFSGREEILLALVREGFSQLHGALAEAARTTSAEGGDAVAAVRAAAHAYLDFALTERDLYHLMYGLAGVNVPSANTYHEGTALGELLGGLLAAVGPGESTPDILQLWATGHGLIALLGVGRIPPDAAPLHDVVDATLDSILAPRIEARAASG